MLKITNYLQRICDEHFKFMITLFIINSLTTAWSLFDEEKADVAIGYIFSVWLGSLLIACLIDLLPKRFLQNTFVKGFSAYISGSNLLTISKEREHMEMNVGSAPQTRFYNLGVKVTF